MALTIAALLIAALPFSPAAAQPQPPQPPGLSPEVAALPATSRDLDPLESERDAAAARLARDRSELADTQAAIASLEEQQRATDAVRVRREAELAKADAGLERHRSALRSVATEWFVSGTADRRSIDPTLGVDELQELRRQAVLGGTAAGASLAAVRFLTSRSDALAEDLDLLGRQVDRLAGRADELVRRHEHLTGEVTTGQATVAELEAKVAAARLNATVDGTDISTIALDAYWRAQQVMSLVDPDCRVSWWALAGIGRTESRHGTYLGSEVAPGGRVEPPILGPPLDGSNGFRVVPDSDGGALDGDAANDRAVGPMQFLPGTWRTVGRDGTGDGKPDPDNVYDAALGAATYLCRSGDLSAESTLRSAYLTYNRSLAYVETVLGYATAYRDALAGLPGR